MHTSSYMCNMHAFIWYYARIYGRYVHYICIMHTYMVIIHAHVCALCTHIYMALSTHMYGHNACTYMGIMNAHISALCMHKFKDNAQYIFVYLANTLLYMSDANGGIGLSSLMWNFHKTCQYNLRDVCVSLCELTFYPSFDCSNGFLIEIAFYT